MEPVSETAHYVVRDGTSDLFLVQEGRLEAPDAVPILWNRRAEGRRERSSRPGTGGGVRRRAARILWGVLG
ncbi:MAG TPA: hypothetical protein VGX21_23150 [Methylomirabilota bacterium]|jgi:hypothetical protein|nr:hypothetical protein [Methylomirabilota bacterium]